MKQHSPSRYLQCFIIDFVLLLGAACIGYYIRSSIVLVNHRFFPLSTYASYLLVLVGSWLIFLYSYGLHGDISIENRSAVTKALLHVNYQAFLLVAVISFVFHLTATNRAIFGIYTVLANLMVLITRRYWPFTWGVRYVILGGDSKVLEALQLAQDTFPRLRSNYEGLFSIEGTATAPEGLSFRGSTRELFELLSEGGVDTVIVAIPDGFPDTQRLLDDLRAYDVEILRAERTKPRIEFVSA